MSAVRRSAIWNVFTETHKSDFIATCNICSQEFSYRSTTTNLMKHLQRMHPGVSVDLNSVNQKPKEGNVPKEVEIVIERQLENKCEVKSFKVEVQPGSEENCDFIVLNSGNTSRIWDYFTKVPNSDSVASCNLCQKEISYKTSNWNLKKHLDRKHPEQSAVSGDSNCKFIVYNSDEEASSSDDNNCDNVISNSRKNASPMWNFFTKIPTNDSVAVCNFCQKNISYKSTTTNLQKHIDRKHPQHSIKEEANVTEEKDVSSRKSSPMWDYFTKVPNSDFIATCNYCSKEISYKSTTGNLQKHMDRKHPKEIVSDDTNSTSEDSSDDDDDNEESDNEKSSAANSGKRESRMWDFFTKLSTSDSIAACNFCQKKISYKSSTGNLQKHIDRKHTKKDSENEDTNNGAMSATNGKIMTNEDHVDKEPFCSDENDDDSVVLIYDKKSSPMWRLFTKIPDSESVASCNICHKKISYKTTTGNLHKHISRRHPDHLLNVPHDPDPAIYQNESFLGGQLAVEQQQQQREVMFDNVKELQSNDTDPNDIDNDFWNLDNSDDDPDFRPSPTFEDALDVKTPSTGKKRSQIWNAFTEKPMSDCVAICNVCNQEFCYRSTTNNLKKHFQRKHPNMTFETKIERVEISDDAEESKVKDEIKTCADDDDRDSSDETVVSNSKRKRSQIWNYFTRKKPNEYVATCNICKKELGFKSTTSNLKKHLDRKHPHIEIKTEHDADQKKSVPEVPVKTCLICLQNDQTETREFIPINNAEPEEKSYMTKIQDIMNQTVVIDESHVICKTCVDDLEKVIQFKEKISKAFDFWSKMDTEPEPESFDNYADDINNSDYSDLEDGESLAKFTCNKCNKVFPSPSVMLKHNCGQQQSRKEKSSIKKNAIDKDTKFYCELCGRAFNIKWKLNKHLKRCQNMATRQFVCTLCNRVFKKAYHLREHMASHTGERNYSCNLCGKTFQRSSSKHKHMRSHNAKPGEKSKKTPFLCTICGKSFPYSNGASRHMRVHLGERRHQCHICMKRFSQTTHLKVHLRTHSGERPYGCMICGRAFSLNASLRKHMRLHVGSGDFVKLVKNLESNLGPTEIVTEDGMHVLTAVQAEIDMEGNQCIG